MPETRNTVVGLRDPKRNLVEDLERDINVQCLDCQRLRMSQPTIACDAFPDGIPEKILDGTHDHTEPFEGDDGKLYLPLDA